MGRGPSMRERAPALAWLDFDDIGRTLEQHDRAQVRIRLAFVTDPGDPETITQFGGASGLLRVLTQADIGNVLDDLPAGIAEAGQRELAFKVGGLTLGVTNVEYRGGSFSDSVLSFQVGTLVMSLNFRPDGFHERG